MSRIKLQTIPIKGKNYVEVHTRIIYFRESGHYEKWSLTTEIIDLNVNWVVMRAIIKDETDRVIATGTAFERSDSNNINKTSYIENAETSAWGRALGNLGIGIVDSIATKEEVEQAIKQQEAIRQQEEIRQKEARAMMNDKYDKNNKKHKSFLAAIFRRFGITGENYDLKNISDGFDGKPLNQLETLLTEMMKEG